MKTQKVSPLLLVLAFSAIYFVWGTTYMANLYALKGIKPFLLSAFRYIVAGVLLTVWCTLKKLSWPDGRTTLVLIVSGIIMLIGGSGLVAVGEQYVNSGYAAVIVATEPFWFVLLDKRRWGFYFSNKKVISGLVLGFGGIVLFSNFATSCTLSGKESDKLTGTLIILGSAILWVLGTLFADRNLKPDSYNSSYTAIQLLAAGSFSFIIGIGDGEWKAFSFQHVSSQSWLGLAFLIIFGSLVAYLAFAWLITVQPPAIVSTHTFINPLVAIFIGWLIGGENLAFKQITALIIVITGVVLTQLGKREKLA
jgi:drug/metabolite transporter (DMT)-like permease